MKYNYLVIEGNIGAGKTSLARKIAYDFNAHMVFEQFADNPFLPKFYNNPQKYSFQLELSFLASRYSQIVRELSTPDLFSTFTVADYYLAKSLIFASINLNTDEYNLFRQLFDIIYSRIRRPDLYVFLAVEINKLMHNIKCRGREYEQNIKQEYLEELQKSYFRYLKQQNDMKILILDVNRVDFVSRDKDYQLVKDHILNQDYKSGINRVILP